MIPMNRDLRRRLAAGALGASLIAAPAIILSPQVAALWERAGVEKPSLLTDPSLAMLMMAKMSAMMSAGDSAAAGPNIANLFATTLYEGNGSSQSIVTGFQPNFVWIKRTSSGADHALFDSQRGALNRLISNSTAASASTSGSLTAFNSNGFSIGSNGDVNSFNSHVAWSFARAARFFDVVTWTGDGTFSQSVAHGLGVVPGAIFAKRTDGTGNWFSYVRRDGTQGVQGMALNSTAAAIGNVNTSNVATSATFQAVQIQDPTGNAANTSGHSYVAYIFAHDTAADGVVQCGSFTTGASTAGTVSGLPWRPQFLLLKRSTGLQHWTILDTTRGWSASSDRLLFPSTPDPDSDVPYGQPNADGFSYENLSTSSTYVYLAIRAAA